MPIEPSKWTQIITQDPDHSYRYIERFKRMAANGADLYGEARLIDAMVARNSRILDAGCGPGRHSGYLHQMGHLVVGVDGDPVLIDAANRDNPGPKWIVSDLAELDLPSHDINEPFDAILCAGNVMTFLAPSTRVLVLANFAKYLSTEGRAVVGFGAGRGYEFQEFLNDVSEAGLEVQLPLSTWDLRPFRANSNFLVAILGRK